MTKKQLEDIVKIYDGRKSKELDFYLEHNIEFSNIQLVLYFIQRQYGKSFMSFCQIMFANKDKNEFTITSDSPEMYFDPDYKHNITRTGFKNYIKKLNDFIDEYFKEYTCIRNSYSIKIIKKSLENKIEIEDLFYTPSMCKVYPNKLFVFGDNTLRIGKAGQACIRDEPNSFGIATKISPSTMADAYFRDDSEIHWEYIKTDIEMLKEEAKKYDTIVFPKAGLGTGLSYMPNKCPKLFEKMANKLKEEFGFDMLENLKD